MQNTLTEPVRALCQRTRVDDPTDPNIVRPNGLKGVAGMPFRDIQDADERGILTATLAEYCNENRIGPDTAEYDDARQLLIMLFERHGNRTVADLKAALVAAVRRER